MNNHSCVTCGSPPRFCRGAAIALDGGTPDTKDVTTPLRYLFRLALVLFAVSHILPAAVDCRNPRTRQQRVVCANPNLMDLDRHLSSVYEKALAVKSGAERQQFAYDQSSWEDSSGGCWEQVDCIREWYTDRILFFQGLGLTRAQIAQAQAVAAAKRQEEQAQKETTRLQIPIYAAEPRSTLPPPVAGNQPPDDATPAKEITPQQSLNPARPKPQTTPPGRSEAAPQEPVATGRNQTLSVSSVENVQRPPAVQSSGPDGFLGLPIDSGFAIGMIVLFTLIITVYCLPTIVAFTRRHRNRWVILIINLAFGATLIGWVGALVWAMNSVDAPVKGGVKIGPQPPDAIL